MDESGQGQGIVAGPPPTPSGDSNRTNEEPGFYVDHLLSGLLRTFCKPALLGKNC